MTDEERIAFRDELLAEDFGDLENLEEPSTTEFIKDHSEHSALIAECLQEAGWPAVAVPGGGITYEPGIPAEQRDEQRADYYYCEKRYFLDPALLQPMTDDQLGVLYDYWVEYFIPCMEAHGYTIDIDDRPSREAYIDQFYDGTPRWWPNERFNMVPLEEQHHLIHTCPPEPPPTILYGVNTEE